MICYRTFGNWDPPALADLWNSCEALPPELRCVTAMDLDRLVFSKPYFEPSELIVAESDGKPIGFIHVGFGANETETELALDLGVVAMIMVDPSYQRQGIGSELMRRGEECLKAHGAGVIYGGPLHPLDPYYLGMYGGSELPGILDSNTGMQNFLTQRGYQPVDTCVIFRRELDKPIHVMDSRARRWTRRIEMEYELQPQPHNWWHACRYACLDDIRFLLRKKDNKEIIATAVCWEMYPLERSWGNYGVGITELDVQDSYRQQGVGLFFIGTILRHYQNAGFKMAEVQTMERNVAAVKLYNRLGFEIEDRGTIFRAP